MCYLLPFAACPPDMFFCDYDTCINVTSLCDTIEDCDDGTDESHPSCVTTTTGTLIWAAVPHVCVATFYKHMEEHGYFLSWNYFVKKDVSLYFQLPPS